MIFFSVFTAVSVSAEERSPLEEIRSEAYQIGEDTLQRDLDNDASSILSGDLPRQIWNAALETAASYKDPFIVMLQMIGLIILIELCSFLRQGKTIDTVTKFLPLGAFVLLMKPLLNYFLEAASVLETGKQFVTALTPVITGISAASGKPVSSSIQSASIPLFCSVLSAVCTQIVIPLIFCTVAVSFADSFYGGEFHSGIVRIQGFCSKFLVGITVIFSSVLSLQSFVAGGKDGLAVKTGKIIAGNLIPIIGSAVSEATSTVYMSLSILRSGIGIGGIGAILFTFLPVLTKGILWLLCLSGIQIILDMTDFSSLSVLCNCIYRGVQMFFSMIILFMVFVIVSFTSMILVGG